jgi:translocation and assembly module TamB
MSPPTEPTAAAVRPRRPLLWLFGLLAASFLLSLALLAAAPFTAPGSRLLLGLVPDLQVSEPQGALLGDFQAAQLRYQLSPTQTLLIEQLSWQGLQLDRGGLQIRRLAAKRIDLQGHSNTGPIVLPTMLALPLAVQIDTVQVDQLEFEAIRDQPVQALQLVLRLAAGPQALHHIEALQFNWDRLQAHGQLSLGAAAPLPLDAKLQLQPLAPAAAEHDLSPAAALAQDWHAELQAQGPLADISLVAQLQARRQSLRATAQIHPAAAMPLAQLNAHAESLDLSAFASQLPGTALSGDVSAQLSPDTATDKSAAGQPLSLQIDLRNERPARIDQGGIPLQRLRLAASSDLQHPQQGKVTALTLELGTPQQPAGQLQGTGRWKLLGSGAERHLDLALDARLNTLQPMRLDQRAPTLVASGPIVLSLLQPWPSAAAGKQTPAAAAPQPLLTLRTELAGRALSVDLPAVQLRLQAALSPNKLRLETLQASAGAARLQASGQIEQTTPGAWRLALDSRLSAFDPTRWWPGSTGSLWRRGPHRLDGELHTDLLLPIEPARPGRPSSVLPASVARLAALQGTAKLTLRPSVLAGLPLAGELTLNAPRTRSGTPPPVQAQLALQLGSGAQLSHVSLNGQLDTAGSNDHWQLQWQTPEVALLNPWWHLLRPGQAQALSGDSQGELSLSGRWPQLHSQGELGSGHLQLHSASDATATSALSLHGLTLQWQAGSAADDALTLHAHLDQASRGSNQFSELDLQAQGSNRAHQLQLHALLHPKQAADSAANPGQNNANLHLLAQAKAEGGWLQEPAADLLGWQGQLNELLLRDAPSDASTSAASPASPPAPRTWLRASPTSLRLTRTPQALQLTLGTSQLQLLDTSFSLQEFDWRHDARPGPIDDDTLTLRVRLEPLAVAPLLARAQPGFGWRGDLQLGGQVTLHANAGQVRADLELHRNSGDLVVVDPDNPSNGLQRLGLNQLRLALNVEQGRWRLTEQVAGQNLGSLDGEQTAQTSADALWPHPDAPVSGQIDLRIAQLGQWGRWLPAGWRLSGQLSTQARVAGRFSAPQLSGELRGQQIGVRNLLQGVDWTDAKLLVALSGETARLQEFSVRAGAGTLNASGTLTLGSAPRADLNLHADHFAALQRVDRRVVLSGDTQLMLDAQTTRLSGQLRADEGRIDISQGDEPGLADDVDVQREAPAAASGSASSAPARSKPRSNVIDLRADLGNAFVLRGRGITTHLTGELRLSNPAGKLAIQGNIRTDDGNYAAYGQKLDIDRGLISFVGPADNPNLDIVATRPDLDDVHVGVAIAGTAQSPRIRLFSEPEMSSTDKLSWLMLGRASDGLGRTDLALLQRTAYALLLGESDSPSLVQRIGLDELSVHQTDGEVRETVVTLGKQLSRRWYVGYERGLNAASGTWQLIYRAAQRFTLRAQSSVSDRALDLIWTWKWNPNPAAPASTPSATSAASANSR